MVSDWLKLRSPLGTSSVSPMAPARTSSSHAESVAGQSHRPSPVAIGGHGPRDTSAGPTSLHSQHHSDLGLLSLSGVSWSACSEAVSCAGGTNEMPSSLVALWLTRSADYLLYKQCGVRDSGWMEVAADVKP